MACAQGRIAVVDLFEGSARGAAVELRGLLADVEAAAETGEERLLQGEFAAEGVDGGDAQLRGKIEEIPAEGLGARERALGEGLHGERILAGSAGELCGIFEFGENAVTHLGGGGFGEGDGDNLAGIVDFAEQAQESACEQIGFAGAGGRADEDGAV